MRRLVGALALLCLSSTALCGARPQEGKSPRFEPVEVVSAVEAEYPPTSVAYGTVVLQVTVGKLGSIDDVKVIHDIPSLTQEAERTVRKWKFRPATFDGKPVASLMVASFTFSRPFIRRGKF